MLLLFQKFPRLILRRLREISSSVNVLRMGAKTPLARAAPMIASTHSIQFPASGPPGHRATRQSFTRPQAIILTLSSARVRRDLCIHLNVVFMDAN
jgi:hypothetical protein